MSGSPDPSLVALLTERELRRFEATTPESRRLAGAAAARLPHGVASDFQRVSPWPVHLVAGEGARVEDADGASRIDLHNGFGASVHGHANPAIGAAVGRRFAAGSQLGAPGEDATAVADGLARRWGLPLWRFASSGTEAATAAIRIARAATARRLVVRAAGGYHGIGVAEGPDCATVAFNDPGALAALLAELERAGTPAACVILEPALMLGCVVPDPGYLEAVREITREAGALLIFDEAKTGLTVAPGGATERFGVRPDLVVIAKALGAGLPVGAVGGDAGPMSVVGGAAPQAGTFNGNAVAMAAARCGLERVLTASAHDAMERTGSRMAAGLQALFAELGFGARAISHGARGSVVFATGPVRDEEDFLAARRPDLERLLWLFAVNRGIYLTPGRPQGWTLSVAHGEPEADAYVALWARLLDSVRSGSGRGRSPGGTVDLD